MLCAGEAEWECGSAVGRASMEIHGCLDYRAEHAHPKPLCLCTVELCTAAVIFSGCLFPCPIHIYKTEK